jgi:hypothetical protein
MIGTIEMLLFSDPFHTAFDTIKILSGTRDTTHQGVTPRVHLGFQGFPPAARLDELAWPYVGRGTEDRDEIAMVPHLDSKDAEVGIRIIECHTLDEAGDWLSTAVILKLVRSGGYGDCSRQETGCRGRHDHRTQ